MYIILKLCLQLICILCEPECSLSSGYIHIALHFYDIQRKRALLLKILNANFGQLDTLTSESCIYTGTMATFFYMAIMVIFSNRKWLWSFNEQGKRKFEKYGSITILPQ